MPMPNALIAPDQALREHLNRLVTKAKGEISSS